MRVTDAVKVSGLIKPETGLATYLGLRNNRIFVVDAAFGSVVRNTRVDGAAYRYGYLGQP
jgi:hypothetical protein